MNRKLRAVFLALLLSIASACLSWAADGLTRLEDMADLLSDDEEEELLAKLDEISGRQQVDVVVVTVNSLEGKSAMAYADDFYDYNGYGFGEDRDGILLLVSMEERDWHISTAGWAITAFTDAGQEYMSEQFLGYLGDGDYAEAFHTFADLCDDYITQAASGEPYDVDHLPEAPFSAGGCLIMAFGAAFLVSLIATGIMKGQLKTVRSQREADNYIRQGSMQLTKRSDRFLYRHVDRRRKAEKKETDKEGGSTTHTSSSGTTHGGSGGKF